MQQANPNCFDFWLLPIPTVLFHPCCRHDIQTTAVVFGTSHRLEVPLVTFSTVGKRAFPVSGATVWNGLPLHVASAPSLAVLKQRLETFLFSCSYQDISYDSCVTNTMHHYLLHLWSLQCLTLFSVKLLLRDRRTDSPSVRLLDGV